MKKMFVHHSTLHSLQFDMQHDYFLDKVDFRPIGPLQGSGDVKAKITLAHCLFLIV